MYTAERLREQVESRAPAPETTLQFLDHILPDGGLRVVAVHDPRVADPLKRMRHKFLTDNASVAQFVLAADRAPLQLFFGVQGYGPAAGGRKGDNVVATRSLAMDLDCGPDKPHADKAEAITALFAFCGEVGLPPALIVDSGNGIHAYWTFDADLSPGEWKITATLLKAACVKQGFKADPSRTADIASILRPAGSTHRKGAPRTVKFLRWAPQTPHAAIRAALEAYTGVTLAAPAVDLLGPAPAHIAVLGKVDNSDLGVHEPYPTSNAYLIAGHGQCGVMEMIRETGGCTDEPTWHRGLQLLNRCEGGREIAHAWSKGDPRYSAVEVDRKLDRLDGVGPTLCGTFEEFQPAICGACVHRGKIRSPIVLGYAPAAPAVLAPATGSASVFGPAEAAGSGLVSMSALGGGRPLTAMPRIMTQPEAVVFFRPYPFVMDWGGQSGILLIQGVGSLRLVTPPVFKDMISGRYVVITDKDGNSKNISAFDWYMKGIHRPEYDRVVYAPEVLAKRTAEKQLNTWSGLAVAPCRGDWRLMRRHLWRIVCRRDRLVFKYLVLWMAHAVQRPGTSPGVVPVLVSLAEGSGKTTVIDWLCRILGRHSLSLNTAEQLLGKFNAHLADKSFLGVNEPAFAGDHESQRKLKSMITDDSWLIEDKYRTAYRVRNIAHIMFTTNERRAVPAGSHARRFLVLDVDDRMAGNTAYFNALYEEVNGGGVAAMLDFLLRLDISKFNPAAVPVTEALRQQQEMSASLEVRWALDAAQDPEIHRVLLGAVNLTADLYSSVKDYAETHRERVPATVAFGRWLGSIGLQQQVAPTGDGARRGRGWFVPDACTLIAAVRKAGGIHA